MHRCREFCLFVLASLLLSWAVFGDALWGRSLTAPLDIAPTLSKTYQFIDPEFNGVPHNLQVMDQLIYDLPLQWSIYHAYRRGEIPWWDPYTYAGRPLLADSHINGTDPVRVALYLTIPDFVLAYNWTLAAHHLVLGCGLFVLLRFLGASPLLAGLLGLAGQFCGGFAIFIGHPWVTGSLCWYPWIWWVWARGMEHPSRWTVAVGALLSACVSYAGNLQSHAYLPLFGFCFLLGSAARDWSRWKKGLWIVGASGVLGVMLAAPAVGPTVELFGWNDRPIQTSTFSPQGLAMLAAVWPWSLGTFKTVGFGSVSYCYFLGPVVTILALAGMRGREGEAPAMRSARRSALWILGLLLMILSSPLQYIIYIRAAGLGAIAVAILALSGALRVAEMAQRAQRKLGKVVAVWTLVVVAGTLLVVYVAYPRFRAKVEALLLAEAGQQVEIYRPLRLAQVARYPEEVNFTNPEVGVALLAFVLFAVAALNGRLQIALPGLLLVSTISPMLFAARCIPRQSLVVWERLKAGNKEQQRVIQQVGSARLLEGDRIFPWELTHLYGVHVVTGYAAMMPPSQVKHPDADPTKEADWEYAASGVLNARRNPPGNRFQWIGDDQRAVQVRPVGFNAVELSFPPGQAAQLLRTDTYYPGWKAATPEGAPVGIRQQGLMSILDIPTGASGVHLRYQPTGWSWLVLVAGSGLLLALLTTLPKPHRGASTI